WPRWPGPRSAATARASCASPTPTRWTTSRPRWRRSAPLWPELDRGRARTQPRRSVGGQMPGLVARLGAVPDLHADAIARLVGRVGQALARRLLHQRVVLGRVRRPHLAGRAGARVEHHRRAVRARAARAVQAELAVQPDRPVG